MITKQIFLTQQYWRWHIFLLLSVIIPYFGSMTYAQMQPDDYIQVGSTDLYYSKKLNFDNDSYSIDIIGKFEDSFYRSTYANCGYDVAMQVGNDDAVKVDCLNGSVVNGVKFEADVIQQADLARVCYHITNTNDRDTIISLGIHADVMIGDNDSAPIIRKIDTTGNTYGLALLDGNGAQLCVLFGTGLVGVTGINDYWFGSWSSNDSPYEMVGNYYADYNWMIENGSYDSGMGWCWKNRTIPAGATVTFSWLIGVGDVKLEPNSNFEVTPEDPDGWNDLSRIHVLSLEGDYESPAGLAGLIEYAVEDSEEWIALTDTIESGSKFRGEVRALFNPSLSKHTIKFRTRDQVGNTTLLPSIVYPDVAFSSISGIEDKVFTGDSIFQTNVDCDLGLDRYVLKNYQNNVNIGVASFNVEGVFPYTIGRKPCHFTISPAPLVGEIVFASNTFVYNGEAFTPEWSFTETGYELLEYDVDYTFEWFNNVLPGTASLTVTGKGNYTGSLIKNFFIDKAPLTEDLYQVVIPDEDIVYDGEDHGVSINVSTGVGDANIAYVKDGILQTETPIEPGEYEIYLEIAEGTLFYGLSYQKIGAFTIYQFDEIDWQNLQTLSTQLVENCGWSQQWDFSHGIMGASHLTGLTIEQGHVTGLDLSHQDLEGELPSSILLFPTLKALDLSGNNFTGNIGIIGNNLPNLCKLDASNNKLSQVSPILPASIQDLNLNSQNLGILDYKDLYLAKNDMADGHYNILFYNHAQQDYSTIQNLTLQNFDGEDWLMFLEDQGNYYQAKPYSSYTLYKHENGDVLRCYSSDGITNHHLSVRMTFDLGDVNFDTNVNIADLQQTVNYAVGQETAQLFNYTAADIQADDWVNIQDVVSIVNIILNQGIETRSVGGTRTSDEMTNEVAEAQLEWRGNQLVLISKREVAAMDIVIENEVDVKWLLGDAGYNYSINKKNGYTRIIHYSMGNKTIKAGETVIAEVMGNNANILKADLVSKDATPIRIANVLFTGIMEVPIVKDYVISANVAGLIIQNGRSAQKLQWEIYSIGGLLLGKGMTDLSVGTNMIGCNLVGENHIVVRLYNNNVNITTKVSITK